jgi:tyrosyl-tRNA synthetase
MLDRWFTLLTTVTPADRPSHPMEAKKKLARFITARFHGEAAAAEAQQAFEARFSKREIPTDLPELTLTNTGSLIELIVDAGFAPSKSEARRLIQQGGVKIDGVAISDQQYSFMEKGTVTLQVGKLKLAKITLK